MKTTIEHDKKVARLTFASVYPYYVAKIEKKQNKTRIASGN